MELVLQQKQTLNLMMTTELRQAIELLQYSTYELHQFLQEQELENPLIELVEKEQEPLYKNRQTEWKSSGSTQDPLDFIASDDEGMREKLIEQTQWLDIEEIKRNILRYLVLNLDENGYLPLSDTEISAQLGVDETEVQEAIEVLHQLEPIGVGARNLSECLLLQLRHYYPEEKLVESIINHYLDFLADRKWNEIAKIMNITLLEVKEAYEFIRKLNPKPCTLSSNTAVEYLNPDIIIDHDGEDFIVQLNDSYIPEIRFNSQYSDLPNSKISEYVQGQFKNYQWLQNSIEQRRSTILKIINVILIKQSDFFTKGFAALKPLTLKEVADEIDMHESTVSRATTNKVIQTPKGSFDLRVLFSTRLNHENGNAMSQTKVKLLLEEIVKQENKYKPFSDQKIADYFKMKKEITISRRTVAKYRDELNIPSSSKRREFKV